LVFVPPTSSPTTTAAVAADIAAILAAAGATRCCANAGLVECAHGIAEDASKRLIHILVDGLRAEVATDAPPAPSPRRTRLAMHRNADDASASSAGAGPPLTSKSNAHDIRL
jgi:hypothetical protein